MKAPCVSVSCKGLNWAETVPPVNGNLRKEGLYRCSRGMMRSLGRRHYSDWCTPKRETGTDR